MLLMISYNVFLAYKRSSIPFGSNTLVMTADTMTATVTPTLTAENKGLVKKETIKVRPGEKNQM